MESEQFLHNRARTQKQKQRTTVPHKRAEQRKGNLIRVRKGDAYMESLVITGIR